MTSETYTADPTCEYRVTEPCSTLVFKVDQQLWDWKLWQNENSVSSLSPTPSDPYSPLISLTVASIPRARNPRIVMYTSKLCNSKNSPQCKATSKAMNSK